MNQAEIERFIGNCLSASINDSASADKALSILRTGRIPWERVAESSNRALVTPALRGFLCNTSVAHLVPAVVRHHVDGAYLVSERRNRALWDQTLEVVGQLNEIGVNPVLLKGAANLAAGLYPRRGSRMMCDIDLLVPKDLLGLCVETLFDMGYVGSQQIKSHRHHHPALHYPGKKAYFELHREPLAARDRCQKLLNRVEVCERATICRDGSATFAIPPAELRVVHAIVHDMIADQGYTQGKRSSRYLYDVFLLSTRYETEICWTRLTRRFARNGRENIIEAYKLALEDVMGWRPPERQLRSSRRTRLRHWQWLLQRRSPSVHRALIWFHGVVGNILTKLHHWAKFLSQQVIELSRLK